MNSENNENEGFGYAAPGGAVVHGRDTELLEKSLLRSLTTVLEVPVASLYHFNGAGDLLRAIRLQRASSAGPGEAGGALERYEDISELGGTAAEVIALTRRLQWAAQPCVAPSGKSLLLGYPLFVGSEVSGGLVVERDREASADENVAVRAVLDVFASYHAVLDLAQRDRLTGFFNRDRMWTALSRPDFLAAKNGGGRRNVVGAPNWLAVIDLDQFQEICARHGQAAADAVVQAFSHIMASTFRATDLLYRYRGEEFVTVVAAENRLVARSIFERLRSAVDAHVFRGVGKVTVSIGYCRADPDVLPLEVMSRADRSLHQARLDGLNRCYEYHDLVESGVFADE